jgi:hypothetical protein
MGTTLGPLHLLAFAEALADDLIKPTVKIKS